MSIHHQVTVHCDGCGMWEHGDARSTIQRRRAGWCIWRPGRTNGPYRHLCPGCVKEGNRTAGDELAAGEYWPDGEP